MIEQITIRGTPPFAAAAPTLLSFRRINYLFGTNGVGTPAATQSAPPVAGAKCSMSDIADRLELLCRFSFAESRPEFAGSTCCHDTFP